MKLKVFSYSQLNTFVHRLSGFSKLVCFLLLTTAIMFTYDYRPILLILALSFVMMKIAKIRYAQVKTMWMYVTIFLTFNFILTYLFAPGYGTEIYGTRHVLVDWGKYSITQEELYYLVVKTLKYLSVIPLGMVFILTTDPSEFASSMNGVGIPYKVCTSLSLTLRYFPDIARDYNTISLAQQARGVEMSSKAPVKERFKNVSAILVPLIMSTMDRIDLIANAMDLRGYGKSKKRTWYARRPLTHSDYACMIVSAVILIGTIYLRVAINHSMFYNPFVQ